jgi:TonB-linked SusC/RagA family outer membrane protein
LYGSRGASGVLLVTTKNGSGKDGKFEVGINSSFSVEDAYVLLQRQDKYGQGYGIPFATNPSRDSGENWSWGPAFDGIVRPWTSPVDSDGDGDLEWLSRPYTAVPDQIHDFFDTGHTLSNSVHVSGSKENFTYYLSYSNTNQDGILQNTSYDRNTFKLASSAKLSKKLTSDFSISYAIVDQSTAQEGQRAFEGQNAYANAIQAPVNIPYTELRDYKNPFHSFTGFYGSYTVNPYFVLNENVNDGKIKNLLGNMQVRYNILDNWDVTMKVGLNNVQTDIFQAVPQYQYTDHFVWYDDLSFNPRGGRQGFGGSYASTALNNTNLDFTGLTNYGRQLSDKISADLSVGFNWFQRKTERLDGQTVGGIVVPGFYHLSNSVQSPIASNSETQYRIMGLFGNLRFGFENKLFVEYSARNDWSSTLPEANNSFFYQAVGASAILSDMLNVQGDALSFLKLRASFGTTGKDAPLYLLNSVWVGNPTLQSLGNGHDLFFPLNGQAGYTLGNTIGNPDLRPELTTTFEAGVDASFLNERIALEYTFYQSKHTDQIVVVTLPDATGFSSTVKNLGEMQNTGHELGLTLRPLVSSRGLNWDISLLYSKNNNEVIRINPEGDQDELTIDNFAGVNSVAAVGLPYGTFKGQVVKTNSAGQTVVDASGNPLYSDELEYLGSYQPDFLASLASTFGFRGLSLNVLFDMKKGGQFLSYTKDMVEFNGTALTTLIGDREYFVVENSVMENADGTYSPNTTPVAPYDYIRNLPFSDHLIDASYVKLREIGLKYQLPKNVLSKTPFKNATVGVYAKNVKFWLPDENTFADPEVTGPALTGNATGIETTQVPPSRSYGVTLSLIF